MKRKFLIEGNVPAVVTPFNEAGDFMGDKYAAVIEWHLANGADAICLAGDNGEAWTLTPDERKSMAEIAMRTVKGRVPVMMGASAPMARQTIAYAEIAANAGVDALMTGPQSYVGKATLKELVDRFVAVHKAVPLPIVAYNSPRRTGVNLDADKLGAICDVVNVIGLKEASRDIFHITDILKKFSDRLCFFAGPCPFILQAIALGARGFIASGPELYGKTASRLIEIGQAAPNDEYRRLHFGLTRIYEFLMATGTWPAALKAALNMMGVPAGLPREPVQPLSPKDSTALKAIMEEIGVLPGARQAQAGE
jgi:4-hydroxy-tetrahydrodipicolinate synthase